LVEHDRTGGAVARALPPTAAREVVDVTGKLITCTTAMSTWPSRPSSRTVT
jgi:hypothetical protein